MAVPQLGEPRKFTLVARWQEGLYALPIALGFCVAVVIAAIGVLLVEPRVVIVGLVVYLAVFPLTIALLGAACANGYIESLVGEGDGLIVEVEYSPRSWHGIGAFLDTADDVGRLRRSGEALEFVGDAGSFALLPGDIKSFKWRAPSLRALWLSGRQARLVLNQDAPVAAITIRARQGLTLVGVRRAAAELASVMSLWLGQPSEQAPQPDAPETGAQ